MGYGGLPAYERASSPFSSPLLPFPHKEVSVTQFPGCRQSRHVAVTVLLCGWAQKWVRRSAQILNTQSLNFQLLGSLRNKQPVATPIAGIKGEGGGTFLFQPFHWDHPHFTDEDRDLRQRWSCPETQKQGNEEGSNHTQDSWSQSSCFLHPPSTW